MCWHLVCLHIVELNKRLAHPNLEQVNKAKVNNIMKNKYTKLFQVAAVGALALASSPSVHAVATLRINDGVSPVLTIGDGSVLPFDLNPLGGGVTFAGTLGVWTFLVTSGTSKPVSGSATVPEMHFSVQATSNSAAPLNNITFQFSDEGFGPSTGIFTGDIGGALATGTGNKVTYETFVSTTNALFAGSTLTSLQTFTPPPASFSGTAFSSPQSLLAPYALTQTIKLTHINGSKTSSADAVLGISVPDGGLTVALLGGAMVGLVAFRKKLRTA